MPSPPLGYAANKSNVVHSLTEVIHQVQERRADTFQCMQNEHDSTLHWLNEKFDVRIPIGVHVCICIVGDRDTVHNSKY
jgi:hypothetical protein